MSQKELKAVASWLKKDGNSKAVLAARIGYLSSQAIHQWFRRKNIPIHMRKRAMEIIKK